MRHILLLIIALSFSYSSVEAQNLKEIVVVMKSNYTYEDPRWSQPVTLEKGEAITAMSRYQKK